MESGLGRGRGCSVAPKAASVLGGPQCCPVHPCQQGLHTVALVRRLQAAQEGVEPSKVLPEGADGVLTAEQRGL